MKVVSEAPFTWALDDVAALIPRTVAVAEAHFELVQANYRRLAKWFPDAFQEPPVFEETQANLREAGQAWLDGDLLPLSIAVPVRGGWRLIGWARLEINRRARSAEIGYWLDEAFVGGGLVSRTVKTVLDHAFGPMGLERVMLVATADNARSRKVAERFGFTQEGVLREAAAFPNERRDLVVYGLLAREWEQECSPTS